MEVIVKSNTDKIVEIPYIFKSRGKVKVNLNLINIYYYFIYGLLLTVCSIHNRGWL